MNQEKKERKGFYLFSQSGFVESEVALPFYVSGTGISQASKGQIEQKRGILNHSSGFLWVLSGTLEVYDGPRLVPAERNHICFSLSGEDQWHRVLSEECTFRWLTLAGPLAEAVLLSYRDARHQIACHPYPEGDRDECQNVSGVQAAWRSAAARSGYLTEANCGSLAASRNSSTVGV